MYVCIGAWIILLFHHTHTSTHTHTHSAGGHRAPYRGVVSLPARTRGGRTGHPLAQPPLPGSVMSYILLFFVFYFIQHINQLYIYNDSSVIWYLPASPLISYIMHHAHIRIHMHIHPIHVQLHQPGHEGCFGGQSHRALPGLARANQWAGPSIQVHIQSINQSIKCNSMQLIPCNSTFHSFIASFHSLHHSFILLHGSFNFIYCIISFIASFHSFNASFHYIASFIHTVASII